MRAVEYIIQEHSLFSKKCFHFFMDILYIFDLAESPRNHRLVCDNDSKSSRLVDLPDRVDCAALQRKVLFLVYKTFVLVDRTVPVHKDTALLIFQAFIRDHASRDVCQCLLHTVNRTNILHILRGAIAVDRLSRVQHSFDHIVLQIPFHRLRHVIADLLFKHKNSCVDAVLIPVIADIVLRVERRYLIIRIQDKKIRVKRMSVRMNK